jgi:hypothetical protein
VSNGVVRLRSRADGKLSMKTCVAEDVPASASPVISPVIVRFEEREGGDRRCTDTEKPFPARQLP